MAISEPSPVESKPESETRTAVSSTLNQETSTHDKVGALRRRFPQRQEVFYVFGLVALPVFFWSLIVSFNSLPSLLMRLSFWDVIGVLSYDETFALIESLIVLIFWLLVTAVLPGVLLRDKFVALSTPIILLSGIWVMVANYNQLGYNWPLHSIINWGSVYLVSLAVPYALVMRFKRIQELSESLAQRVALLAYLYIGIGCLGLLIVILRNVWLILF